WRETGPDGKELAAHRAGFSIRRSCRHQLPDEVRFHQHVRVQGENPIRRGQGNGLILRSRKTLVAAVAHDPNAFLKLAQDFDSAVRRRVVHDHYVQRYAFLPEGRVETPAYVLATVVRNNRHADALWHFSFFGCYP